MKDINEKQIEEMTSEVKNFKERTRFLFGWDGRPKDEIFATLLLEAGYRKQSDTVREFVERLKNEYLSKEGNFVYWVIDVDDIAKIAKEYGVEVEEC